MKQYQAAGKIWKKVEKVAVKACKPGESLLKIANTIENSVAKIAKEEKIKEAGLPFPVNLSINHEAAHATPSATDEAVLDKKDVLKVDIGVHVDGYIADGAITVNVSNDYAKMIEAADLALENALSRVKVDRELWEIGKAVEDTLEKNGYKPVQNLSGHGLEQYEGHASPSIPNINNKDDRVFEENMAFAIEPFASNGKGFIHEGTQAEIFSIGEIKQVRNPHGRKLLEFIVKEYGTLYFAERWLEKVKLSDFQRKVGMRELLKHKCIVPSPVLKEDVGTIITQAEKTVVLLDGKMHIIN